MFSAKTQPNNSTSGYDVPTVEYTPISTIRASTTLYVQNITQNVLFGLTVYGEGCYLWVYNAELWVWLILDLRYAG